MAYFANHELKTVIKHCNSCKSTGILVGVDQVDAACCYDCMLLERTNAEKKAKKVAAWEAVRPTSADYPKRVEKGREMEDLPRLFPGDKAVIAPVHPVVTVRKNYLACKKLRHESISLLQDPQQTWCKILPRTDLHDRFVVVERTTKDHSRRHIVADKNRVRAWLQFLFKNHTEFIRMESDGDLQLSQDALTALQSQLELGEVVDDVEYDTDEDQSMDDSVNQPALESGFSRAMTFTASTVSRPCI